ncbi:uncharacterized protein LOC106054791 [Biomphalaria glabrata]|uniref:Uncharacterized protein LOC106054791 n=1 Tax=Biomphalaria glabrata TaxID=6526 RepID=A0A9U8DZ40_BIOGL|nr:uncharacterized protein LOC106054791 [Biomphalaria glabrata]
MTHQWHLVVGILGTLFTVAVSHTGSCSYSKYGCCPDGITPAEGYGNKGCYAPPNDYPTKPLTNVGGCKNTRYGCCPDGRTPASGYGNKGCYPYPKPPIDVYSPKPPTDIYTSKPDNYPIKPPSYDYLKPQPNPYDHPTKPPTNNYPPNPPTYGCKNTRYGCCPDGHTPASGYGNKGCYPYPKPPIDVYSPKPPTDIYTSKPDNYPPKPPSDSYPKPQPNPYDYPTKPPTNDYPPNPPTYGCKNTRYGCCPDGHTPASGYGNRGCY